MGFRLYQVDAFTDRVFGGNPAAVVPLPKWLDDATLLRISNENNLSETAFMVQREADLFDLRWFTPRAEVKLCGHATLAAAFILFEEWDYPHNHVRFHTRSGELGVSIGEEDYLKLDFPLEPMAREAPEPSLAEALGAEIEEFYTGTDWMAVLHSERAVRDLKPNLAALEQCACRGLIVTAPASESRQQSEAKVARERARTSHPLTAPQSGVVPVDFVSRFFAPQVGIPEDPVTGSAHCALAPYWGGKLGKDSLCGRQLSRRGGEILCRLMPEDRIELKGRCALYMVGEIVRTA
jgi:PhzF family phenazine biosynthesis protein